jgi:hydroxymethylpyrimidine/phosphomethylpyrimidine kinase
MSWGTSKAIIEAAMFPDVIWDEGGMGKEPMIRLLGFSATQIASRAIMIAETLDKSDRNL